MSKQKVLLIGMLDSIHLSRWLEQFKASEYQILVFPSTYFRLPHEKLKGFYGSNIRILGQGRLSKFSGYIDSIITLRFLGNRFGQVFRKVYLRVCVAIYRPRIIHAIEIQHAGYLVSSIKGGSTRRIITNWGSDIYYFQHVPGHVRLIKKALAWATHYSAECFRDYELASVYGFNGVFLPKIPNAGGFNLESGRSTVLMKRELLLIKCYGGTFGLGGLAIKVSEEFLYSHPFASVFLYSVTPDLTDDVKNLKNKFPDRVQYSTLISPMRHEDLLELFHQSKVYLGLSRSDGLSTSFLEALLSGTYPIQSNTSCASEIINLGAVGSIVSTEYQEILSELCRVFGDEKLISDARELNYQIAVNFLDYESIRKSALTFYSEHNSETVLFNL